MMKLKMKLKTKLKIYFAHSIYDLNTEYEKLCLNRIREEFKNKDIEIINTKAMLGKEDKLALIHKRRSKKRMAVISKMSYFIEQCDLMVCAKTWNNLMYRGIYGEEVLLEIDYGLRLGKKIMEFSE
jgi:hypothetical protein